MIMDGLSNCVKNTNDRYSRRKQDINVDVLNKLVISPCVEREHIYGVGVDKQEISPSFRQSEPSKWWADQNQDKSTTLTKLVAKKKIERTREGGYLSLRVRC